MAIDIAQLGSGEGVNIGLDYDGLILAGDSHKSLWQIAEDFSTDEATGLVSAVNPADFSADSGWTIALVIDGTPFTATATWYTQATGLYWIAWDSGATTGKVGRYSYVVEVTNAGLSAKRTIQHGTIVIS